MLCTVQCRPAPEKALPEGALKRNKTRQDKDGESTREVRLHDENREKVLTRDSEIAKIGQMP